MKLYLASNNPDKRREIVEILYPHEVILPDEAGIKYYAEETGSTLKENALIKAKTLYKKIHKPVIADDTGLVCDFLNGAPGVYSARFAGENASYEDNRKKLIELAKKVTPEQRTASFITVAVLMLSEDSIFFFEGKVTGIILTEERGANGFGYDPIFFYPERGMTFAEMSTEEKNKVSHRYRAFSKLKSFLDTLDHGKGNLS